MIYKNFATAMVSLALQASAAIVEDGLWTDSDWYDDQQ